VIDGEAVCCAEAVFGRLHSRAHDDEAFLCAFHLLELDDEDWRARPLEKRKAKLQQKLLTGRGPGSNSASTSIGTARTIFANACKHGRDDDDAVHGGGALTAAI
jgi:ATP-dependent DNA ligase